MHIFSDNDYAIIILEPFDVKKLSLRHFLDLCVSFVIIIVISIESIYEYREYV